MRVDEAGFAQQHSDLQERTASEAATSATEHSDAAGTCGPQQDDEPWVGFLEQASIIRPRVERNLEKFAPYTDLLENTFGKKVRADLCQYACRVQVGQQRASLTSILATYITIPTASFAFCFAVFFGFTLQFLPTETRVELAIAIGAFIAEIFVTAILIIVGLLIMATVPESKAVRKLLRQRLAIRRNRESLVSRFLYMTFLIAFVLSAVLAVGLEMIYPRKNHSSLTVAWLYSFVNLYVATAAGLLTAFLITGLMVLGASRYWIRADTAAFQRVCITLSVGPEMDHSLAVRKRLISQLEGLSWAFRRRIPRQLGISSSDPSYRRFVRIANEISALRTWVAFPQRGTADAFCERMALIGGALASNMYHFLQFDDEFETPPEKARIRTRVLSLTSNIALGLLPIAALLVVHLLQIKVPPQIDDSWAILSIIWLVATVLAMQPDFKERVADTKDIFSMIGPANRG